MSVKLFTDGIEPDPGAVIWRFLHCWKFEDLETAAEAFARTLNLQAHNADALNAMIAIAIERKDHQAALDLHRKLKSIGHHSPDLAFEKGHGDGEFAEGLEGEDSCSGVFAMGTKPRLTGGPYDPHQ